jgi:hypothetical protein
MNHFGEFWLSLTVWSMYEAPLSLASCVAQKPTLTNVLMSHFAEFCALPLPEASPGRSRGVAVWVVDPNPPPLLSRFNGFNEPLWHTRTYLPEASAGHLAYRASPRRESNLPHVLIPLMECEPPRVRNVLVSHF